MCTGTSLLYKIPRVIVGENKNYKSPGEKWFLERNVNYGFVHLLEKNQPEKYDMLALQIKKLMASCDVLLESWQLQLGDSVKKDFEREKMFHHIVRYVVHA